MDPHLDELCGVILNLISYDPNFYDSGDAQDRSRRFVETQFPSRKKTSIDTRTAKQIEVVDQKCRLQGVASSFLLNLQSACRKQGF